jgi:hypothetical protein
MRTIKGRFKQFKSFKSFKLFIASTATVDLE